MLLAAHACASSARIPAASSVPHRRLLPRRGDRHRARERRGLHRLRELSDGLPLRRAPAEPEDQHHREVHAVLPAQKRRELGAGLRAQLLLRRSHPSETWTIRTPRPRRSWLPPARTRTTCSIRPTCIPRRSTSSRRRPPSGGRSPSRSPATRRSSHFAVRGALAPARRCAPRFSVAPTVAPSPFGGRALLRVRSLNPQDGGCCFGAPVRRFFEVAVPVLRSALALRGLCPTRTGESERRGDTW